MKDRIDDFIGNSTALGVVIGGAVGFFSHGLGLGAAIAYAAVGGVVAFAATAAFAVVVGALVALGSGLYHLYQVAKDVYNNLPPIASCLSPDAKEVIFQKNCCGTK